MVLLHLAEQVFRHPLCQIANQRFCPSWNSAKRPTVSDPSRGPHWNVCRSVLVPMAQRHMATQQNRPTYRSGGRVPAGGVTQRSKLRASAPAWPSRSIPTCCATRAAMPWPTPAMIPEPSRRGWGIRTSGTRRDILSWRLIGSRAFGGTNCCSLMVRMSTTDTLQSRFCTSQQTTCTDPPTHQA